MCIVVPAKPKSKRRRNRSQSGHRSESGRHQSSRGQGRSDRQPPRCDTPYRDQLCYLTEGRENPRNRERSGRRETRRYRESPSPESSPSPPPRRASRVSRGRFDDREYREAPYRQDPIDEGDWPRRPPHAPELETEELPDGQIRRFYRYTGSDPHVIHVTEDGHEVIRAV